MSIVKFITRNIEILPEHLFENTSITELYCNSVEFNRNIRITPEILNSLPINPEFLKKIDEFNRKKELDKREFNKITKSIRPIILESLKEGGVNLLPNRIGELSNLEVLDLSNNLLETIPDEIGNLTNLRKLNLANNNIKELPKSISKLVNLEYVNLTENPINKVPTTLSKLPKLIEKQEERRLLKVEIIEKIKENVEEAADLYDYDKTIGIHIGKDIRIEYALFGDNVIVQP